MPDKFRDYDMPECVRTPSEVQAYMLGIQFAADRIADRARIAVSMEARRALNDAAEWLRRAQNVKPQ